MALRLNTNITAMTAWRNIKRASGDMRTSVERLSSGLRINHANDDPAGMAIAEKIRTQVQGLTRASMNALDGVSLLQTAEAALGEIQSMLQRIRELAIQASNGTLTANDRVQIQREVDQLLAEVDRTAVATEFNTKKLLDGTSAALVSTDSANLTPMITGTMPVDRNYRLETEVSPGQGQVLKSDIFRIVAGEQYKQGTRGLASDIDKGALIADPPVDPNASVRLDASDFTLWQDLDWSAAPDDGTVPGSPNTELDFEIEYATSAATGLMAAGDYGVVDYHLEGRYNGFALGGAIATPDATTKQAPYLSLEVVSLQGSNEDAEATIQDGRMVVDAVTFDDAPANGSQLIGIRVTAHNRDGTVQAQESVQITAVDWNAATGIIDAGTNTTLDKYNGLTVRMGTDGDTVTVGDKVLILADPSAQYAGGVVQVAQEGISQESANPDDGNRALNAAAGIVLGDPTVEMNRVGARADTTSVPTSIAGLNTTLSLAWLDADGKVHVGTGDFRAGDRTAETGPGSVTFNMTETTLAERVTELQYVDRFATGINLFETGSQTITMYANGQQSDMVLQARDSLEDLAHKMRTTITSSVLSGGLGMGVDGDMSFTGIDGNTAVYVSQSTPNTDEAIEGTLVLRSTLPGDDGRFFFSGDERLLNAFSWAEVVSPVENAAEITVHDAHTGEFIDTQRVNDGVLRGVLAGVDVKIDASEDVSVEWDATNMKYTFKSGFGTEVGHIHVVANPLTLQVGANPGQKVDALIGEVTRSSLELENVLLVNRAVAEEAIPIVDKAIEEVSSQRARIGAYINRLNATINILDITAENLSASESRIRDLDMANQTIDFTRDQMLVQAATAMLAQANTLPQSVLTLLR